MGSYLSRSFEQETSRNRDRNVSQRWDSHSADIVYCSHSPRKDILYESRCARNESLCTANIKDSKFTRVLQPLSDRELQENVPTLKLSIVPLLRKIYILYNAHDANFVNNNLQPRLDNEPRIHLRRILPGQERHLNSWRGIELKDRRNCKKVAVVVLSDHYLQDIERTSQYKEIHRCHKTLIIQVGQSTTSDVPYKLFGQICIKISWFTWPEQKAERVGFWNVFTSHIDP